MRDHEKLTSWLREAAREIENAHRTLDELGAPHAADDGTPISLALRIAVLVDTVTKQSIEEKPEGEQVAELIDAIVALWEDAEHDHARDGMFLTLRQDLGYNLPFLDEGLPSLEELRAALLGGTKQSTEGKP